MVLVLKRKGKSQLCAEYFQAGYQNILPLTSISWVSITLLFGRVSINCEVKRCLNFLEPCANLLIRESFHGWVSQCLLQRSISPAGHGQLEDSLPCGVWAIHLPFCFSGSSSEDYLVLCLLNRPIFPLCYCHLVGGLSSVMQWNLVW